MVSQSMSTPLYLVIFFIGQIKNYITSLELANKKWNTALHYIEITQSQIHLTQSYMNDLLDFQQIKDGVFKL